MQTRKTTFLAEVGSLIVSTVRSTNFDFLGGFLLYPSYLWVTGQDPFILGTGTTLTCICSAIVLIALWNMYIQKKIWGEDVRWQVSLLRNAAEIAIIVFILIQLDQLPEGDPTRAFAGLAVLFFGPMILSKLASLVWRGKKGKGLLGGAA